MPTDKNYLDAGQFAAQSFVSSSAGLLRANRFRVEFNFAGAPNTLFNNSGLERDALLWNCVGATVSDINCDMGQNQINGVPRNFYKNRQDGDLGLTFLEDNQLRIRRFFHDWISLGFNLSNQTRGYYDDVSIPSIKIYPVTPDGQFVACDVYESVLPYYVGNIDYNMHNEDVLIRTDVRFKYTFHKMEYFGQAPTESRKI